jgi:Secretion system C-terminal sorting domain
MKVKFLLSIAFSMLIYTTTHAQCSGSCIDIQLRNTNSTLEVWLMPTTATYTGSVSLTFTISWDATYTASLGTETSLVPQMAISIAGSTQATITNGSRKYNVYSAAGGSDYTLTSNISVKIMEVALNGANNATTGHFSISDDAFTTANNYDYFVDIGGSDLTGATSSIATNVVLPLELLDFKGVEQDKSVLLNWKTANEQSVDYFEVERSNDTKTWINVAKVPTVSSQNHSNTEGTYFTKDDEAFNQSNTVLYRLKMIHQDGSFMYSKVVSLQHTGDFNRLKLYPNPTHNQLQLTIESDKNTVQTIEIVDIVGKIEQQTTVNLSKGTNQQTLDVRALPSGIYFLKIRDNKGVKQTIKWVKL